MSTEGGTGAIGTTEPSTPLSVSGTTSTQTVRFEDPSGNYRFLQQLDGSNLASRRFRNGTTGVALQITSDGDVGVGTTSPDFKLEVNGSAGKPGGGSWSNSSDRRLKKNIRGLEGSLDNLLALRGVTDEYKDPDAINELHGTRIGMIVQEVEEVFPNWVSKAGHGYKTLTFRGFEALTVEALRELRDEKDTEIASLRAEKDAQIADLTNRLDRMEAMVSGLTGVVQE